MRLQKLREKIDLIDVQLVNLLNKRANLILDIAKFKKDYGKSFYCPDRERQVLKKVKDANKGPLTEPAVEAIYREIMSSCLALEKKLRIAYLGPQATFTHLASMKRFGTQVTYVPCDTISDVFLKVERDKADYGVVPVENSIEGAINHSLDMMVDSDLKICAQIMLNVSHNLLAKCPMEKIRRIYSKPEVFGQCRAWLQENLPKAELLETSSTTKAAQIAARESASACIASLLASKIYGLNIVAGHIEDSPRNVTKFFVIGKTEVPPTGKDRTSILFSIKDSVGALHEMLIPFKRYKINLTKIESRPSKKKAWDYYFFVELEGHRQDEKVKKALAALESSCKFLKIIGSYPVGE